MSLYELSVIHQVQLFNRILHALAKYFSVKISLCDLTVFHFFPVSYPVFKASGSKQLITDQRCQ
jgi:hypothetical protein